MMRLNPIIKRDLEMRSRRLALPSSMILLNSLLFIIGLLGAFGVVSGMQADLQAAYGPMLKIYALVAGVGCLAVLLVSPLYTAGAISGEKETGTFDLLLNTRLTPLNIVLEKLLSASLSMGASLISLWPPLLVPLMFGGVGMEDATLLLGLMIPGAFLMLCIGIFASALCDSSVKSMALAYGIGFALIAGTVLTALLMRPLTPEGSNYFVYLLAADPLLGPFVVLCRQLGHRALPEAVYAFLGLKADPAFLNWGPLISVLVQLSISVGLVLVAVLKVSPGRFFRRGRR